MQVKRDKKTVVAFVALAVLVVGLLGTAGFFAKQYYDLRANPAQATQAEREQLVNKVSKLYALPKDEQPIVGEVRDIEKLKDQPFFQNAKNGDKILIYQKAKLAIVYREGENKLINVGPIAIDAAPQEGGQEQANQDGGGNATPEAEATTPPATEEEAATTP